jgi:hypothetical protein
MMAVICAVLWPILWTIVRVILQVTQETIQDVQGYCKEAEDQLPPIIGGQKRAYVLEKLCVDLVNRGETLPLRILDALISLSVAELTQKGVFK